MGQPMPYSKNEPIISCEHLYVAYGGDMVLHDICLEISRGSFLPFVGANGAGKTTLVKAILGLIKPRLGRVRTPFRDSPPGYVPQQKTIDPLYPVSVRQIVMMGLYPQLGWWRMPNQATKRRVEDALERFDLLEHAQKTFGELSGGMKQKVLVVRAFLSEAEVFVMDEPTSELDEQTEREVLSYLHGLSRNEGKTVLLALHGLNLVEESVDEICLLNQGRARLMKPDDTSNRT
jgi:ABC-type Mn2+/Zn2+ transport system ATPase subunit